ncbi:tryptophan synthase subunit alpha [Kineobactrum salinum]|nr:tryptophan synthase subunit alpha [Kineobactrum salinum]
MSYLHCSQISDTPSEQQDSRRNRLDWRLASGRPLLTCYFPVGDPAMPPELLRIYADCGVDVVELGLPTADPFMDGAAVRNAMARGAANPDIYPALAATAGVVRSIDGGPAVLCMSYTAIDLDAFLQCAALPLLDGLLMLGLDACPRRDEILAVSRHHDIRQVRFVDWELDPAAVEAARASEAYLMLQAAPGPTGARQMLDPRNALHIKQLRARGLAQPILLGFGISTPQQAAEAVAMGANGVVIGSRCLQLAQQGPEVLSGFLRAVRESLDG